MKTIFVVEDDENIRELIEFLLTEQEYLVESFPNARSFHKKITTGHPDLILLDVMLPDGNGIDICNELRDKKETNKIPIILMSAHATLCEENCASDFIPKPFDIDDFLDRILVHIS